MKTSMSSLYLSTLICFSLTGCQAVSDTLATVNGALNSVNSVLSGTAVTSTAQSSADSAIKLDQIAVLKHYLIKPNHLSRNM